MENSWFVYMIEAASGQLYTGITTDPERRFREHREGVGAKFFRRSPPRKMRFKFGGFDRSSALRIEFRIKQLSRAQKLKLRTRRSLEILLNSDS
jgi:putative endonuclease